MVDCGRALLSQRLRPVKEETRRIAPEREALSACRTNAELTNSALALAATGVCLFGGGPNLMATSAADYALTATHATAYIVAIWTWSFAVIGIALRFSPPITG